MTSHAFGLKRFLITQLLCVVFACIAQIHTRLLISYIEFSGLQFYIQFILMIILFTIPIYLSSDGELINALLISLSFIGYWVITDIILSVIGFRTIT